MREGETYSSWVWAAESPRGATDQDGRVPKSAAQSSVGLKYLYASRPWSPVAEAYHNRARWYSPEAGRFLTRDPIGYLGGVNQYMYATGNPIGFRDPWGLRADPEGGSLHSWTAAGWAAWMREMGVGDFQSVAFNPANHLAAEAVLGFLETGQSAAYLTEGYDADGQLTGWGYAGYGAKTAVDAAVVAGPLVRLGAAGVAATRTAANAATKVVAPHVRSPSLGWTARQLDDLVARNGGRHRVEMRSPTRMVQVDLAGRPHAGVPTPHTLVSIRNLRGLNQPAYNTKQAIPRESTDEEIRMVRRYLKSIGR